MAGPDDLYGLLREYLEACALALVDSPGGPIDPSNVFVVPAVPAFDCCPQLTVHAGGPVVGPTVPLSPPASMFRTDYRVEVHMVNMVATVIRCVPGMTERGDTFSPPTAIAQEEAARIVLGDVWTIWNRLRQRIRAGDLFADARGSRREVDWAPAVPVPAMGGCAGWQLGIAVRLDGYPGVV